MAKLPAFMFYPGDWIKDPNLRRCSPAARGVWIDMLCLMFECEERGALVSAGAPWADSDVHAAIGGDPSVVALCLSELLAKGVVRRREDGALCSRRMVRDEQIRLERSKAGCLGGRPPKKQIKSKPKAKTKQSLEYETEKEVEVKSLTKGGSKGGRAPNPLWDAVVAEWSMPITTKAQRSRVGAAIAEFDGVGATPAEITVRRKLILAAWGVGSDGPESTAKHWGEFRPGVPISDARAKASAAYLRKVREDDAKVLAERKARIGS